jgi:hypothetical protein
MKYIKHSIDKCPCVYLYILSIESQNMRSIRIFLGGLCLLCPIFLPALHGATVTWIGGSSDWDTPADWSTDALPGTNDDVVIPAGPAITVTHSTGADTVHSVQSQQALVLSGGRWPSPPRSRPAIRSR